MSKISSLLKDNSAPVLLERIEEEYLLRNWEESLRVRTSQQLFLWAQGQMQSVLPHQVMVCIKFDENRSVQKVECIRGAPCDARVINQICNETNGLAIRLALHCAEESSSPVVFDTGQDSPGEPEKALLDGLKACKMDNALVHGSGPLKGGAIYFVLLAFPREPSARHVHFMDFLLPALHLAFLRVLSDTQSAHGDSLNTGEPRKRLTEREIDVLHWVGKGKTNAEIGIILGLSEMTVKNHLQKIFRKLEVTNRTQATLRAQQVLRNPLGQLTGRH